MVISNALGLSKEYMDKKMKKALVVVDATMGNGFDTCYLRSKLDSKGFLYAFDIQKTAIENTKKRLIEKNIYSNVLLINDSHAEFKKYIDKDVDLIIYNLGYLPKGDKNISTSSESTLISIKSGMDILNYEGLIIVTIYPGHLEGKKEFDVISEFLKTVDQKKFEIMKMEFYNHINNPPVLFIIERKN
ncbi:class I SAM-dependent methyltransferase [Clostridiaceae bacterium HSG29]|nr:class I SAM-dependent methyltransferase [Clostridiaceae bacterium HSG29]